MIKSKYFVGTRFNSLLNMQVLKYNNNQKHLVKSNLSNKIIRNNQSVSNRLKLFRPRLYQIWQWRRNRKSFQSWRGLRFLTPYSIARFSKIRRRTGFRLQRALRKYAGWRLMNKVNVQNVQSYSKYQNQHQKINDVTNNWFTGDIGNKLIVYDIKRNRSLLLRSISSMKVNESQKFNLLRDGDVLYYASIHRPTNKLALETSQLLGVLTQNNLINKQNYYKYSPRLQRSLNFYYSSHK